MFPRMRGPGKVPPARTVGRLKPSGARFWLTMCRSVTGPIPAMAGTAMPATTKASSLSKLRMVQERSVEWLRKEELGR